MDFGKKGDAKKALKLAWKDHKGKGPLTSAELKRAWKKTMRFGDTVCPPGEEPNTWWTGGKGQRQCIKQCGLSQMRNPDTNRCKNMVVEDLPMLRVPPPELAGFEFNPKSGKYRKICDPPKVRNEQGRCVVPRAELVLKPGYEINPETGRARKMCKQDEYRDPVTKRCRKMKFSVQPLIWQSPSAEMNPLTEFSSFGRRNRYGGRKCGFGSCMACNMK